LFGNYVAGFYSLFATTFRTRELFGKEENKWLESLQLRLDKQAMKIKKLSEWDFLFEEKPSRVIKAVIAEELALRCSNVSLSRIYDGLYWVPENFLEELSQTSRHWIARINQLESDDFIQERYQYFESMFINWETQCPGFRKNWIYVQSIHLHPDRMFNFESKIFWTFLQAQATKEWPSTYESISLDVSDKERAYNTILAQLKRNLLFPTNQFPRKSQDVSACEIVLQIVRQLVFMWLTTGHFSFKRWSASLAFPLNVYHGYLYDFDVSFTTFEKMVLDNESALHDVASDPVLKHMSKKAKEQVIEEVTEEKEEEKESVIKEEEEVEEVEELEEELLEEKHPTREQGIEQAKNQEFEQALDLDENLPSWMYETPFLPLFPELWEEE